MKRHIPREEKGRAAKDGDARRPRAAKPPRRHREEPEIEPIRIPPEWMPSDRRGRRHPVLKGAILLAGFGLLSLPFVYNHIEKGSFYYQEEAPVVMPPVAPPVDRSPTDEATTKEPAPRTDASATTADDAGGEETEDQRGTQDKQGAVESH